MARLANAFDLLGEDSDDVSKVVAIVDASEDAAGFLAAEKKRKEEAKRKEEDRQQRMQEDAILAVNSVLFRAHRPSSFRRRSNFPQYNDVQHQGQRQRVQAPVVQKEWVPKSESQNLQKEEAKKEKETQGSDAAVDKQQIRKEEGVNNNGGDVGSSTKSVVDGRQKKKMEACEEN